MGRTILPQFHAAFSIGAVARLGARRAACAPGGVPVARAVRRASRSSRSCGGWPRLPWCSILPDAVGDRAARAGARRRGRRPRPTGRPAPRRVRLAARRVARAAHPAASASSSWPPPCPRGRRTTGSRSPSSTGSARPRPSARVVFGVFVGAMTVVRLLGTRLIDRYGRVARAARLRGRLARRAAALRPRARRSRSPCVGVVALGLRRRRSRCPIGIAAASDDPLRAAGPGRRGLGVRVGRLDRRARRCSASPPRRIGRAARAAAHRGRDGRQRAARRHASSRRAASTGAARRGPTSRRAPSPAPTRRRRRGAARHAATCTAGTSPARAADARRVRDPSRTRRARPPTHAAEEPHDDRPSASAPGRARPRAVVRASTAVFTVFVLNGFNFASWAARLPAVRDGLGLHARADGPAAARRRGRLARSRCRCPGLVVTAARRPRARSLGFAVAQRRPGCVVAVGRRRARAGRRSSRPGPRPVRRRAPGCGTRR